MQSNERFWQVTAPKFLLRNKINRKMSLFIRERTHKYGCPVTLAAGQLSSSVPAGDKKVKSFGKSSRKRLRWKL